MKLCVIYSFAAHYRGPIFKMIDQEYDCDWFFGKEYGDVNKMDYTQLTGNVTECEKITLGPFTYLRGIIKLAFNNYDNYLILLGPLSISSWLLLLLLKLNPRKKIYGWTHGWYGKETKIKSILKKFNFKLADGVFVYGNYAKQLMIKEGFNPLKVFVIHNSLDYEKQIELRNSSLNSDIYSKHFGNNNQVVIFIGRLTKVKKLNMLIESIAELKKAGFLYNVVFVGDGTERETLINQTQKLDVSELIWFYGACYDEKKNAELLYNADLCVAPGNVGLTAMHSMVFGTPVISHNNFPYQMPEFEAIIPGKTGDFFNCNDTKSLSLTIHNWLSSHRNDRENIRQQCYKEIDTNWTPQFQLDILKKIIHA